MLDHYTNKAGRAVRESNPSQGIWSSLCCHYTNDR